MNKPGQPSVLIITSAFPRKQGEERDVFMLELCRRLASEVDLTVLVPHDKGFPSFEEYEGMQIYKHAQSPVNSARIAYGSGILPNIRKNRWLWFAVPYYFLFQLHSLRHLVRKKKISIINAHWLIPQGLTAAVYKRFFNRRIKLTVTIHGTDLLGLSKGLMGKLQRYVLKNCDHIITVSQSMKDILDASGFGNKVTVRSMGIDTTLFSPGKKCSALRQKYNIKGPMLLFVGAVIPAKGIETLIQAFSEVLNCIPDAKLMVVGEGNLTPAMKQRTGDLGIADSVIFTGPLPHSALPEYFATADVFVLPSHSEGFGLVVAEAMSCETLVIATEIPALSELIASGQTGFLVPVQDAKTLAAQIIHVLQNRESLHTIGANARKRVKLLYDWEVVIGEYRAILMKNEEGGMKNE
jgi:glycosyltransferase involved in cell wall biosynthesis